MTEEVRIREDPAEVTVAVFTWRHWTDFKIVDKPAWSRTGYILNKSTERYN
jgi:hypothetical protein